MSLERIDEIEQELTNIIKIGDGGQKEVYSANHASLGKVAFKKTKIGSNEQRKRMEREASILKGESNNAFPKVYEISFSADGSRCVIVEEFLEAETLRTVMAKYYKPKDALILLKELTKKLSVVWQKNIVHRDLKPENIMIEQSGNARIIDFGCARVLDERTITLQGIAPMTIRYAAPEQLKYDKKLISIRTDQFALGVITGELIFKGNHPFSPSLTGSPDYVTAIFQNNWYRNGVKQYPNLTNLLERLLAVQPYMRFKSGDVMVEAIELAIGDF